MAVRFADRLPVDVAEVAKGYWLEGKTMRELAETLGMTLHQVRRAVETARTLLIMALSGEQAVPADLVCKAMRGRRGS